MKPTQLAAGALALAELTKSASEITNNPAGVTFGPISETDSMLALLANKMPASNRPESSVGATTSEVPQRSVLEMLLPYLIGGGLGAGIGYAKESEGDREKNRSGADRALRGALMGTGTAAGINLGGAVGAGLGAGVGGAAGLATGAGVGGLAGGGNGALLGSVGGAGMGMAAGAGVGALSGAGLGGYGGYKLMRKVLGQ